MYENHPVHVWKTECLLYMLFFFFVPECLKIYILVHICTSIFLCLNFFSLSHEMWTKEKNYAHLSHVFLLFQYFLCAEFPWVSIFRKNRENGAKQTPYPSQKKILFLVGSSKDPFFNTKISWKRLRDSLSCSLNALRANMISELCCMRYLNSAIWWR